jgi:glycosyltransferase involved in cell wall biosynthesis
MLRERLYYGLKPYLPWRVRMGLRRILARKQRRAGTAIWPVNDVAARTPEDWPGWPDGKKFAFVLTHDVESPGGLAKCRRLAELDRELGFHSSFNFVPEGSYTVPPALRTWLTEGGFEVGVHDFNHDGRLFISRRGFSRKASRINHYLHEWGSAGFRSAFMLRNLGWLHELDIRYDSSTFDTDPFELQSRGTETIFPFWIPKPPVSPESETPASDLHPGKPGVAISRGGYIELPYTLPQDSTLFLLLRETSPAIWNRKLDWIAEHGGMALVNVHPDYLQLEGEPASSRTYPVAYYVEFLKHVRQCHGGAFWQHLPRELAEFATRIKPRLAVHRPKRVCMITHSFYESDNRVTRYAEALTARGDRVDVLALRRSPELPREENIGGVRVFRIQNRFKKTERSFLAHLLPLFRFLVSSSWWVTRQHARQHYDFIHVHNVPDFLVFAAWYPKLTGSRIILDIHDIVPEFFASKFGKTSRGMSATLLKWMERASARFADHVIVANDLWLDRYAVRTGTTGRCTAFINNVDTRVFLPQRRRQQDGKLIVLFPGGLQWHQGVDIAIRAFKKISSELPNAEFHIYGNGNAKESLVKLAAELGLNGQVRFWELVNVREIAAVMADADLGVVPKRADSFGNEAYSTKIMEFMAVGVPVVAANTKIDRHYFNGDVVRFFESGNADSLAREMSDLLRNPESRQQMVTRASLYAACHCWENRKPDYLALVDHLLESE